MTEFSESVRRVRDELKEETREVLEQAESSEPDLDVEAKSPSATTETAGTSSLPAVSMSPESKTLDEAKPERMEAIAKRARDMGIAYDEISGKTFDQLNEMIESRNYRAYNFLRKMAGQESLEEVADALERAWDKDRPDFIPKEIRSKQLRKAMAVFLDDNQMDLGDATREEGKGKAQGEGKEKGKLWSEVKMPAEWGVDEKEMFAEIREELLQDFIKEYGGKPEFLPGYRNQVNQLSIGIVNKLKAEEK